MLTVITSLPRMDFCPRCLLFQAMYIPLTTTVSAEKAAEDYEFVIRQLVRTRVISVSDISDCPKLTSSFWEWDQMGMLHLLSLITPYLMRKKSGKAEAVHSAIDEVGPDCPTLPAKMVQPTKGNFGLVLDKAAASKLDGAKFPSRGQAFKNVIFHLQSSLLRWGLRSVFIGKMAIKLDPLLESHF
ncbi:hypothetical protein KY289_034349 [Solanum tuberosum]|nr:hypothetical protein KY289_034349 [Solanum tuberosum]